jgi:hypothetical protein
MGGSMTTSDSRRTFLERLSGFAASVPLLNAAYAAEAEKPGEAPKDSRWALRGNFVEACNCDLICPCIVDNAPSAGSCSGLQAFEIVQGRFGDTQLGGLNVVLVNHIPGRPEQGDWKVGLYVDERAKAQQHDALVEVFSGKAGGYFKSVSSLYGEFFEPRKARIDVLVDGKARKVVIAGIVEATLAAEEGYRHGEIALNNVQPWPVVLARSSKVTYHDHGFAWEFGGKNGFFSTFTYQA